LKPSKIRVGYNSQGAWSTLEEIRCEEVERGNYFPKLDYPPDTLAMWICLTPRKALRYVALAERWDHLSDETQPLTSEEEEMLECVTKIPLIPTNVIVHDDGDEGYLVLRSNKATKTRRALWGWWRPSLDTAPMESLKRTGASLHRHSDRCSIAVC
jgi:hypothetical protein